jgi:hypothetical protein
MSNLIGPRLPGSRPASQATTEPKARPAAPTGHGSAPAAHTLQPRRSTSAPRPPDASLRQRPRVPVAQLHALRSPQPGPLALTVPVHAIEHAQAEVALKNAVTEALAGKALARAERPAVHEADVARGIAAIRSAQDYKRALNDLRTLPSARRGPHLAALMRQRGYSGMAQDAAFRGFVAELADLEPGHRGEALVELCEQFRNLAAADLLDPASTAAGHQELLALAQDMPPTLLREPVGALAQAVAAVAPGDRTQATGGPPQGVLPALGGGPGSAQPAARAQAFGQVLVLADKLPPADLAEVLPRLAAAVGHVEPEQADAARDQVLMLTRKIVDDGDRRSLDLTFAQLAATLHVGRPEQSRLQRQQLQGEVQGLPGDSRALSLRALAVAARPRAGSPAGATGQATGNRGAVGRPTQARH